ncbi:MAG: bifunctional 2-polyprenyl-6-hydroxyphenol methylase/3-demethylubiquinol 3-O-methyltransferase UbiG, partial [Alphaproteobacteria bacterium]|nr:bifunctional 2-polyprenyl-6-hydroxyphenol methylase/3-demethylubiquinol 3-O-methyltransferase UbiG [Alphaproteobacteria bacterium]
LEYILAAARRTRLTADQPDRLLPLDGRKVLDVGCGGGLLAEPLCRLGAEMTAIDASQGAIDVAKAHAASQSLSITYRNIPIEKLAKIPTMQGYFDVIYASEIIEHVNNRHQFLRSIQQLLKADGVIIFTTINKTLPALLLAKFAAEYILNLVPQGTHQFEKFIRPEQLQRECADAGILIDDITGFIPTIQGGFRFSSVTAVNYGASGQLA